MSARGASGASSLVLILMTIAGCGAFAPDLAPGKLGANNAGCYKDGNLILPVLNNGKVSAVSRTSVKFGHKNSPVIVDTPAVPQQSSVVLQVPIPPPIPGGQIQFDITVDVEKAVEEFDEGNNTAFSTCEIVAP